MKTFLLSILIGAIYLSAIAQERAIVSQDLRNIAIDRVSPILESSDFVQEVTEVTKSLLDNEEEKIGNTYYDLQSNSAMQNRIHLFDDGTVGATYTFGLNFPGFADDRGTGYNYFDGNAWGPWPTQRVENDRTGWPAYAAWGENGEIIVAHISGGIQDGLLISTRPEKGTGDWTETLFQGPAGGWEGIVWPRMVTSGTDNSTVHMIYLTRPTANGGQIYEEQDGALLYSRSNDGGVTWPVLHYQFPELNIDHYLGFDGDTYEIQVQGDNVAILVGEPWIDMVLLKSIDGGDSWNKTVVWENPYPLWSTGTVTDSFYCVDGSHALAYDQEGKVHIAFGINRALSEDGSAQSWFPYVDGIGYWNEDRPVFSNDHHALDPYGHPDSELEDDYSLIGYTQDMDGDGEITFVDDIGTYQLGLSSMPQFHIDELNHLWVIWSSVTETYENGAANYRHLWMRQSPNGMWWSAYDHLTDDLIHIFDECIWPSISTTSDDDYLYLLWQSDNEPGIAERFSYHSHVENFMQLMKIEKLLVEVEEEPDLTFEVSQNFPNPFENKTIISIQLHSAANLEINIFDVLGKKVYENHYVAGPGVEKIEFDADEFDSGIYFYTVINDEHKITKKMIVE